MQKIQRNTKALALASVDRQIAEHAAALVKLQAARARLVPERQPEAQSAQPEGARVPAGPRFPPFG